MWRMLLVVAGCSIALTAIAQGGPAPKGDAATVATKIIKTNFPECKKVTNAKRLSDGSIRARCDGVSYMIFTVLDKKRGQLQELALNCTAAKQLLNVSC